jgi:predicted RNA binding protein YcfA (HicA-like mRNA interferase family)
MKIPRDISGPELVKALRVLGYVVDRQKGSHVRITTQLNGENHEVIPHHHPIKTGTLNSILKHVAEHHDLSLQDLLEKLGL